MAAPLDRLLRAGRRIPDDDAVDGQVAVEAEEQDIAAAVRTGSRGRIAVELRIQDRDRPDRVAERRRRAVSGPDIGKPVELRTVDGDAVERDRGLRRVGRVGGDVDAVVVAGRIDGQVLEAQACVERAGCRDLALDRNRANAGDGDGLGDGHVAIARTRICAFGDQDGVAVDRGIHRVLDGGEAAVSDQQEAAGCAAGAVGIGALDDLHAGERVGALAEAGRVDLPARDHAGRRIGVGDQGEVRCRQHAVEHRRVGAAAADQRVVAGAAFKRVVADLAGGAAARLVRAVELVVAVAAAQRVVAALAHDPVVARRAGDGLVDRRLAGLVALDLGVDVGPRRQRDGEARDIDHAVSDAVDVEQRTPVADRTRQVEIGDRKSVDLIEVEDRDRVLVILARHRDVVEYHRSDVRLVRRHRVGVAGSGKTADDLDRIVRTSGRAGDAGGAFKRHVLEGRVAVKAEQLDVGGVAGSRTVGREAGIGHHQRIHRRGSGRIPGVGCKDAAIGEARDRAVGKGQRADVRTGSHVDARGRGTRAFEIDIGKRDVACAAGDVHRGARSRRDVRIAGADIDTDEAQRLAHRQVLGIVARPADHHDDVIGGRRIDRRLDRGEGAELAVDVDDVDDRAVEHQRLHRAQRVGAVIAVGHRIVVRHRDGAGAGVEADRVALECAVEAGGVRPCAAVDRVIAGKARDDVAVAGSGDAVGLRGAVDEDVDAAIAVGDGDECQVDRTVGIGLVEE